MTKQEYPIPDTIDVDYLAYIACCVQLTPLDTRVGYSRHMIA